MTGTMVAWFEIPSFIVTLAMMLIASGAAYKLSGGESVNRLPDSFMWLGRGTNFGIPNAVILMLVLYVVAHIVMSRTTLGRYIYAVGGNAEAARLSGVPVRRILLLVYTVCGRFGRARRDHHGIAVQKRRPEIWTAGRALRHRGGRSWRHELDGRRRKSARR